MAKLGLGKTAWGIVAGMALLNLYALLPMVSGLATVAVAVGLAAGSYVWVLILKTVYVRVLGADRPAAAHVE